MCTSFHPKGDHFQQWEFKLNYALVSNINPAFERPYCKDLDWNMTCQLTKFVTLDFATETPFDVHLI
jgi:hypothetical protein